MTGAACLWSAEAGKTPVPATPMQESIAHQRQAVSSMAVSLEAQRRSLETQLGRQSSFFTLPPLPRLPASAVPAIEPVPPCTPLPAPELETLIGQAAQEQELEPNLLRSVIRQESGDRPCAVSPKGAMGLMQLMPATASQLGVQDPFDPEQNVDGGARLLKQLLKTYGGSLPLALGAFNAGSGRVNQSGGVPDLPETLNYIQRVLGSMQEPH